MPFWSKKPPVVPARVTLPLTMNPDKRAGVYDRPLAAVLQHFLPAAVVTQVSQNQTSTVFDLQIPFDEKSAAKTTQLLLDAFTTLGAPRGSEVSLPTGSVSFGEGQIVELVLDQSDFATPEELLKAQLMVAPGLQAQLEKGEFLLGSQTDGSLVRMRILTTNPQPLIMSLLQVAKGFGFVSATADLV